MTADTALDDKVELKIEEGVTVVDTKSGELYTVGAVLDDGNVVCVGVRDRESCALLPTSLSVVKPALEWEPVGDPTPRGGVTEQESTDEAPVTESTATPDSAQEGAQEPTDGEDSGAATDEASSETGVDTTDEGNADELAPAGRTLNPKAEPPTVA